MTQIKLNIILDNNGLKLIPDLIVYEEKETLVILCKQWIEEYCKPRKTINDRRSSYGLKHTVEKWADIYVSNSAFIHAAIELGYRYENAHYGPGPNAFFNMSFPRKRTKLYKEAFSIKPLPF